jgi:hypothetical protein
VKDFLNMFVLLSFVWLVEKLAWIGVKHTNLGAICQAIKIANRWALSTALKWTRAAPIQPGLPYIPSEL